MENNLKHITSFSHDGTSYQHQRHAKWYLAQDQGHLIHLQTHKTCCLLMPQNDMFLEKVDSLLSQLFPIGLSLKDNFVSNC